MSETTIFVHVGAPRTGTSFLRSKVFPNVKNAQFEDKKLSKTEMVKFLASISHWGDGNELTASMPLHPPALKPGKYIFSEEHLLWSVYHMMGNVGSRALLLKDKIPNAKIILTIRRQPEYYISVFSYFQELERWHLHRRMRSVISMLNMNDSITKIGLHQKWGIPVGISIGKKFETYSLDDKYFNRNWRNFMVADLSWLRLYEIYAELFGSDNVLVLPQETWRTNPLKGIRNLETFFKERIESEGISFSEKVNTSRVKRNAFFSESDKERYANFVMSVVADSNKKLSKKIIYADLEKLGYCEKRENRERVRKWGIRKDATFSVSEASIVRINFFMESLEKMGPVGIVRKLSKKALAKYSAALKRRLYRASVFFVDYIKGVDFEKIESTQKLKLDAQVAEQYESTKTFELKKVLNSIDVPFDCAAIDFGAGKGRVVHFLSTIPRIRKVTGVELSRELTDIAELNLARLRSSNAKMLCSDARQTPIQLINEAQIFYFYNPFPRDVFVEVFRMIEESILAGNKRPAILIYFNPIFDDVVSNSPAFVRRREFDNSISSASTVAYFTY